VGCTRPASCFPTRSWGGLGGRQRGGSPTCASCGSSKRANSHSYEYYSMCRFFSGAGFQLPLFDSFDFVMRIDSDSNCTHPFPPDFFRAFAGQGCSTAVRLRSGGIGRQGLRQGALA